jgi:hypothetical protein
MFRFFKVVLCLLFACALCGCASSETPGRAIAQAPAAPARALVKAAPQNPSPSIATGAAPVAEVPETSYTFGVAVRSNLTHTFVVRNAGGSNLQIKKVLPG